MQSTNSLYSSYQNDEKEAKMEKIKYREGKIVEEDISIAKTIEIDRDRLGTIKGSGPSWTFDESVMVIDVREREEFRGHALYLAGVYEWILCKDSSGMICLVPLRKGDR